MDDNNSIMDWIVRNEIKNEKGEILDYSKHLFLLDILTDWSQEIVIKKAAQIGGSLTFNLKVLFAIQHFKLNVIYTFPTSSDVSEFVVSKTNKLLQANPQVFKELATDNVERKEIDGRFLFFKGTVSDTAPIMTSADLLVHDEVSRSDQKTLEDYKSRTKASVYKGRWLFSNPTTEKDILDQQWKISDQKEWFITCQKCKFEQILKWPDSVDLNRRCFQCVACKNALSDEERTKGRYVAQYPERTVSGYHMSLLMNPATTAEEIIKDSEGDQEYFYNFILGEPYNPGDLRVTRSTILDNWTPKSLVTGNYYLGVDVGNIKHYVLGSEKGVIKVGRFSAWSELDDLIRIYKIRGGVIDSNPDNTMARYYVETYPTQMLMSTFSQSANNPQALVWWGEDDKSSTVYSSRDRVIDKLIYEIVNARILFGLASDYDFREYLKHWETLRRVKETNNAGIERYVWASVNNEDHYCFVKGTLVLTDKGNRNIEDIKIGEQVLTRQGYKKVLHNGVTQRNAEVVKAKLSNGKTIVCTANHPFYVKGKGFVPLDRVAHSDVLLSICQTPSSLMESNLDDIQTPKMATNVNITVLMKTKDNKGLACYMLKFGKQLMDKFQRVLSYITKTIIHLIIPLKILNVCPENNIQNIIQQNVGNHQNIKRNKLLSYITSPIDLRLENGYKPLKEENEAKIVQNILNEQNPTSLFVQPVESKPKLIVTQEANFVLEDVTVVSTHVLKDKENVYNLFVEDAHEYFANGILVSNCFATLYYWLALQGVGNGKILTPANEKPFELIKETSQGPVMGNLNEFLEQQQANFN